jgi:hypothetical protein
LPDHHTLDLVKQGLHRFSGAALVRVHGGGGSGGG